MPSGRGRRQRAVRLICAADEGLQEGGTRRSGPVLVQQSERELAPTCCFPGLLHPMHPRRRVTEGERRKARLDIVIYSFSQ